MRFFFVTVIASLVLVACGGGGDSADPTASVAATSTTTTTSPTTTTTEAVVGTGGLVVTYDGEACAYSGPDRATLDDEISLTFVNESEDVMFVTLRQIPPDRIDELEQLVGTDFDYSAQTDFPPIIIVQITGPGEDTTSAFLAVPGTYVVDCTLFDAGVRLHTWWPAALEVTP
jgi:hypothetical protein